MGTPTRVGCPFFVGDESAEPALLLGENRRHFRLIQMIQRPLYQQMRPLSHATDRQGY
ncbi:hypothetical protein D9M71_67470 [compost metagenome]